jgi:hypothetical protein
VCFPVSVIASVLNNLVGFMASAVLLSQSVFIIQVFVVSKKL